MTENETPNPSAQTASEHISVLDDTASPQDQGQETPSENQAGENQAGNHQNNDHAADDAQTSAAPETGEATEDAPQPVSLEDQITELNDKLLRSLAELENTRRRAERDRAEAQQYGMMRFARDMLSVSDNFGRAMAALSPEARAELPETVAAVFEGIDATERELSAIFERHNIIRVSPLGDKFDPNFHEAMFEAPGTGAPSGSIIEVVEVGYRIGDRLLRPARVGVAKD